MNQGELKTNIKLVLDNLDKIVKVPIGISNHHIHLKEEDFNELFPGQKLTKRKALNQPGEFASNQVVTVWGPKGKIEHVRVLGPFRQQSQVELSATDARKIGVKAPVRLSGNLSGTPGVDLLTEQGAIHLDSGTIIAKRHVHMSTRDAKLLHVHQGEIVRVKVDSPERGVVFDDVEIRSGENYKFEMHVDTDEANAANISPGSYGKFID